MKSRLLVSALGVPLLLYVVLVAPAVWMAVALCILAGIGAYELMKCVGVTSGCLQWLTILMAALYVGCYTTYVSAAVSILPILYVVMAFLYAILRAGEVKFHQIAAGICAAIVIPYAFSSFLRLETAGFHRGYLLLPFLLSFACDTFAYFVGCSIGKHRLAPKVSPKKSIEGSVGGLLGNVVCGILFVFVMDTWFGGSISYGSMTLLALLCGAVAQIGDLSFSLVKREFGVKDYGKLFLEHGGVLDRFDSVLFVAPVLEIVLNLVK